MARCVRAICNLRSPCSRNPPCLFVEDTVRADLDEMLRGHPFIDAAAVLGVYHAGPPFNLMHAFSTVEFLYVLALPLGRNLERVQRMYGILPG